jgi:hypothetical protein
MYKEHAGAEFMNGARAVLCRGRGAAGEHESNMLDVATRRAHAGADVDRPLPSRLVGGAADRHASYADQFEFSFFEHSHFVGLFKTLPIIAFFTSRIRRRALRPGG